MSWCPRCSAERNGIKTMPCLCLTGQSLRARMQRVAARLDLVISDGNRRLGPKTYVTPV